MIPLDATELRRLAENAAPSTCNATPGRWEASFGVHGDPRVIEAGRPVFGNVADLITDQRLTNGLVAEASTAPADYGRARALFIAAADPATVLEILDRIDHLETELELVLDHLERLRP